jgi:hypothetical protein
MVSPATVNVMVVKRSRHSVALRGSVTFDDNTVSLPVPLKSYLAPFAKFMLPDTVYDQESPGLKVRIVLVFSAVTGAEPPPPPPPQAAKVSRKAASKTNAVKECRKWFIISLHPVQFGEFRFPAAMWAILRGQSSWELIA